MTAGCASIDTTLGLENPLHTSSADPRFASSPSFLAMILTVGNDYARGGGIYFDYSEQRITDKTLAFCCSWLRNLAEDRIDAMFAVTRSM